MVFSLRNHLSIKWLITVIGLFLLINGCHHQVEDNIKRFSKSPMVGNVIKHGRFNPIRQGHLLNHQQSTSGKLIKGATLELTEQTNKIPIETDGYFGLQYRISNIPSNIRRLELRRVLIHPEMILPNGKIKSGSDYIIRVPVKSGNVFDLIGYSFNEAYEKVPGNWTFQLWHKDQKLIQQTFLVYEKE